jgi:LacI family transcriptional regulator
LKQKVTIADVAREAGVSTQTVSRVLNNKAEISPSTRELVAQVIERLGYRPNGLARGLASSRTLTIGLSVPDIANPFFPEIARGAEDVAQAYGYNVFLCNTGEDPRREAAALRSLEEKRVDGLIVCSPRLPDEQLLRALRAFPAVMLVNRRVEPEVAGTVLVDDAEGAKQIVHHLLDRGRRALGFLAGPEASHSARERMRGIAEAMGEAGHDLAPDSVLRCPPTLEGGRSRAHVLLSNSQSRLDGLVCYNDLVAVGALRACSELGLRVPKDVAVVGCDDIMLAGLVTPALTTLRVAKYDIGSQAAKMLFDRIQGRDGLTEITLTPEVVVRASAP